MSDTRNLFIIALVVFLSCAVSRATEEDEWTKLDSTKTAKSEAEAKVISKHNAAVVGSETLPKTQTIGATFGAAQNPSNSAINSIPAVNEAAAQGFEISDTVQSMKASKKIRPEEAAILEALLQAQLMQSVQQGSGNSSSGKSSSSESSEDRAVASTPTSGGGSGSGGVGGNSEIPDVKVVTSPANNTTAKTEPLPRSNFVNPIPEQPQAQIIRPDGTAIVIPNIASRIETESSSGRGISGPSDKLQNDSSSKEKQMMSDSMGVAYRGKATIDGSEEEPLDDFSRGITPLISSLGKSPAGKANDPKMADKSLGNTPDSDMGEKDPIVPMVPRGPASEKPEKTWPEWPEVFSDPKVFRDHFSDFFKSFSALSSAAKGKASEPEGFGALVLGILVGLIGVLKVSGNLPFGRKSDVQIIFPSSSEYRPRLIRDVRGWILNLHHRANNNLVAVGLLKEDAVVSADWLSPTIQNELNVEHGGEALRLRKGEFEKTSTPVNPAIRPFPEKIDFLMKSGLLRKKNNA